MKLPEILIAIFLMIICKNSFSQKLNKIEREYFILGTLSDYMGRSLDPRGKNLLDSYYALEDPLIVVVDSLLKKDYPTSSYKVDRYVDSAETLRSAEIFSDTLFKKLNAYYTFKQSGSFTSDNDPELNNRPIFMGALKTKIFDNDTEKLAFLAGTYVRFGMPNDTAYEISIANSYSKALICYHLLVDFKCKPTYQVRQNYIPTGYHVYFHPNKKVKSYLRQFMYLRKRLDNTEKLLIEKIMSQSLSN